MIVIHAADIHLGSPLGGLDQHEGLPIERIRSAPLAAFGRIADLCAERHAELLLIAGDLFDGNAGLPVIREASVILRHIAEGGTQVVIISGNHDARSKMQRRLPAIDGVHELSTHEPETIDFPELGVAVHGRGFDSQHVTENIVATYPARIEGRCNIGVLHTSLEGNAAHATYAPCSIADLTAKGYDYWALGHIHKHGVQASDPWVVWAGSPQGRHVGEVGEHGVYVLDIDDGVLRAAPEHVELGAVQWHRETIEPDSPDCDAQQLCTLAGARLAEIVDSHTLDVLHVVRLELTGRCAAHAELTREPGRWRDALASEAFSAGGAGCFLEKVEFRTQPTLPDASVLRERQDFVGELARHLAAADDDTAAVVCEAGHDEGASPAVPLLARLDEKLRGLGADADQLRDQPPSTSELERAGEDLLARLLEANEVAMEGSR